MKTGSSVADPDSLNPDTDQYTDPDTDPNPPIPVNPDSVPDPGS